VAMISSYFSLNVVKYPAFNFLSNRSKCCPWNPSPWRAYYRSSMFLLGTNSSNSLISSSLNS